MAGELASKLRLVRCPNCRQLLPELPHYDIYKCGGCGTTLQAKTRRSEDVNSESRSHESEKNPRSSSSKKEQLIFSLEKVERTTTAGASSGELSSDENCQTSQNQKGPWENDLRANATECSSDKNAGGKDHSEGEGYNGEELEISNLSDEDLENEMDDSEHSGIKINRHEVSNKCFSSELIPGEIEANYAKLHLAGPEESNNKSLLSKGSEEELYCATHEQNLKSDIPGAAKSTGSTSESASTSKSIANVGSKKKLFKQSLSSIDISLERVSSMDKSYATEVINPSSDFSDTLGELSYSPTTRSSHAYDGSVSSYDGMDEYPGYQHSNPLYNTNNFVDDSDERLRMAKILVDSIINGDSKAYQHLNFSSYFPSENQHAMKAVVRKEFPSKMPFHYSGLQSIYDRGSPPNQLHDEPYFSSTSLPSDTCEDTDQEKMKLLRMIYILQDQLSRNSSVNGETNGRLSSSPYKGKHTLPYYSHELQEERFHQALNYTKCDGRCNPGINWRQGHKLSLNPGSAEATSSANHVHPSCFHCFPREWQCQAELPPFVCQYEGPYMYHHHGNNCYPPQCSYPMNPEWTMNSKASLYSCETKSDYQQRHQVYEASVHPTREKQKLAIPHVRPVAGGAPFITCQHCFRLLKFPADFLLFKRSCRKLKCGSCSKVLKFSVTKSHEARELNDQSVVVNGSNRPSEPDVNRYNSSSADPISYSDNYGLSASKSCSSEDPVSLPALHSLHGCGYDQSVSGGMSDAVSEKETVASSNYSSTNIPVRTNTSAEAVSDVFVSKKVSSQMDARPPPPTRSSPLHRLMGYTSLGQVIRGTKPSTKGNTKANGAANGAK